MDSAVCDKCVQFTQLFGVVDEIRQRGAVIQGKVFLHNLQAFVDSFADGNTGYDNDELAPTVAFVQFEDGFDVGICFADSCLHLDGEIVFPFQRFRRFDLLGTLDILDMSQNHLICELGYDRVVTESCKSFVTGLSVFLPGLYLIVEHLVWLPGKDITYRFCCVFLKLLMFEF